MPERHLEVIVQVPTLITLLEKGLPMVRLMLRRLTAT
jgi:hypothetical protein